MRVRCHSTQLRRPQLNAHNVVPASKFSRSSIFILILLSFSEFAQAAYLRATHSSLERSPPASDACHDWCFLTVHEPCQRCNMRGLCDACDPAKCHSCEGTTQTSNSRGEQNDIKNLLNRALAASHAAVVEQDDHEVARRRNTSDGAKISAQRLAEKATGFGAVGVREIAKITSIGSPAALGVPTVPPVQPASTTGITFSLGQRVVCKYNGDKQWMHGVVQSVNPLRVVVDGDDTAYGFDIVQPEASTSGVPVVTTPAAAQPAFPATAGVPAVDSPVVTTPLLPPVQPAMPAVSSVVTTTITTGMTFSLGQRVVCKYNGDQNWMHGVVQSVDPLRVVVDGDDTAYGFDVVQPEVTTTVLSLTIITNTVTTTTGITFTFSVGQRVVCKYNGDKQWMHGVVQSVDPLRVVVDGDDAAYGFDVVQPEATTTVVAPEWGALAGQPALPSTSSVPAVVPRTVTSFVVPPVQTTAPCTSAAPCTSGVLVVTTPAVVQPALPATSGVPAVSPPAVTSTVVTPAQPAIPSASGLSMSTPVPPVLPTTAGVPAVHAPATTPVVPPVQPATSGVPMSTPVAPVQPALPTTSGVPAVDSPIVTAPVVPPVQPAVPTASSVPAVDAPAATTPVVPPVQPATPSTSAVPTVTSVPPVQTALPTPAGVPAVDSPIVTTSTVPPVQPASTTGITFSVGQRVVCKYKGDTQWMHGVVQSVDPLRVVVDGDDAAYGFDVVQPEATTTIVSPDQGALAGVPPVQPATPSTSGVPTVTSVPPVQTALPTPAGVPAVDSPIVTTSTVPPVQPASTTGITFSVGQRVVCKYKGDTQWMHGVVQSVDPLRVVVDGDDAAYGFDVVQPEATTTIVSPDQGALAGQPAMPATSRVPAVSPPMVTSIGASPVQTALASTSGVPGVHSSTTSPPVPSVQPVLQSTSSVPTVAPGDMAEAPIVTTPLVPSVTQAHTIGQRVQCKDASDSDWLYGVVESVNPLRVRVDGDDTAYEFDLVQPEAIAVTTAEGDVATNTFTTTAFGVAGVGATSTIAITTATLSLGAPTMAPPGLPDITTVAPAPAAAATTLPSEEPTTAPLGPPNMAAPAPATTGATTATTWQATPPAPLTTIITTVTTTPTATTTTATTTTVTTMAATTTTVTTTTATTTTTTITTTVTTTTTKTTTTATTTTTVAKKTTTTVQWPRPGTPDTLIYWNAGSRSTVDLWVDDGPGGNHLELVHGHARTEHVIDGILSHYAFRHGEFQGYWRSRRELRELGLSENNAISVCAVYTDKGRKAHEGILSAWEAATNVKRVAWRSDEGFPETDAPFVESKREGVPLPISDDVPSHVCWTSSDRDTSTYVNGEHVESRRLPSPFTSFMGGATEWRVGDRDEESSLDFEGDVYNIKIWEYALDAREVEHEFADLGKPIITKVLEKRFRPLAVYDARQESSSTAWSDLSGHNDLTVKDGEATLVKDGDLSHYVFTDGQKSYFQSKLKSGISGADTAVSACAVYTDRSRRSKYMTVLSSWSGTEHEHEMAWLSLNGHPATNDWKLRGRIANITTSDNLPDHVCWTTSRWGQQAEDLVTEIYINGKLATSHQFHKAPGFVHAREGFWRIGHWDGKTDDMRFTGDVYSVKIWHRKLSDAEVLNEFHSVYEPILEAAQVRLRSPVAIFDASRGATSTEWPDGSGNGNHLMWIGSGVQPTFVNRLGVSSHYSFAGVTGNGFWQSMKKTGFAGHDIAVSVCAVYREGRRRGDATVLLTSWAGGVEMGHDMKWISQKGHPGTDDGAAIGRVSKVSTSKTIPSHVCWTTSKWESQSHEEVTRIFVNGAQVQTQHSSAKADSLDSAFEGVWQVGHGGLEHGFDGDIWNIKIWPRCLSPADVEEEYLMVGKPIQDYESDLQVFLQLPE